MDKYAAHIVEKQRAAGATPEELQATVRQMEEFKRLYENPIMNAAFTFMEPFPVGVLVSLITAGVLRRRPGSTIPAAAASTS
jgi:hypothetical protein